MPFPPKTALWAARTLATGAARKQAASLGGLQPRTASKPAPKIAPYAACDGRSCSMYAPLSIIAPRNRPFAVVVEARLDVTLRPPADSPPMVTFLGSPPKRAILRCTH